MSVRFSRENGTGTDLAPPAAIDFELDDIYPLNLIPGEPPPHDGLLVAGEPMMYRRLSARMTPETITMRRATTATRIIHRRVVIRGSRMARALAIGSDKGRYWITVCAS